jgi:hypothetical protein
MPEAKVAASPAESNRIEEIHRCRPQFTALLVIDMQRAFLDPGASLDAACPAAPRGWTSGPAAVRLAR